MIPVGVPKEIKVEEKRVALTPEAVKELRDFGATVFVEQGAGEGSGFTDAEYVRAGAVMAATPQELYENAVLIHKVKEPLPAEWPEIRSHHILFGFLHLASQEQCALVDRLLKSGATALAYETLADGGGLPLLSPMSRIAGSLAAVYAAILGKYFDGSQSPERRLPQILEEMRKAAKLYPRLPSGLSLSRMALFGAGTAGRAALETGRKLRGRIAVIEADPQVRDDLAEQGVTAYSLDEDLKEALPYFDALVGVAHCCGARAARVMDEETLHFISRKKKKVLIDVAIDQGGNFPGSRSTDYTRPFFMDALGNLRFCVPNIPSWAGRGASEGLSKAVLGYTKLLLLDPEKAFREHPAIRSALSIREGKILRPEVRTAHQR